MKCNFLRKNKELYNFELLSFFPLMCRRLIFSPFSRSFYFNFRLCVIVAPKALLNWLLPDRNRKEDQQTLRMFSTIQVK